MKIFILTRIVNFLDKVGCGPESGALLGWGIMLINPIPSTQSAEKLHQMSEIQVCVSKNV